MRKLTNPVKCISSSNIRLRLTIDVSRYEGVSQLYLGKTGVSVLSLSDIHGLLLDKELQP